MATRTDINQVFKDGVLVSEEVVETDIPAQVEAQAVIEQVRDPKQLDPSVEERLAALECLLVPPTDERALSQD